MSDDQETRKEEPECSHPSGFSQLDDSSHCPKWICPACGATAPFTWDSVLFGIVAVVLMVSFAIWYLHGCQINGKFLGINM